jgi:hypothetical protein
MLNRAHCSGVTQAAALLRNGASAEKLATAEVPLAALQGEIWVEGSAPMLAASGVLRSS